MKPKYIFAAVFAVCILMVTVLPQLGSPRLVAANAGAGAPASARASGAVAAAAPANRLFVSPTLTVTVTKQSPPAKAGLPARAAAPARTAAPTLAPPRAAAPKVVKPTNAPAAGSGDNHLPSPADPAAPAGAQASAGTAAAAIPATSAEPDLASFTAAVKNGDASQATGVYVPGLFAMPIVQQPPGDVNYVSTTDQVVTEYSRSDIYGVIGLLAHNTLSSGQSFFRLKPGQEVVLVYGDGRQVRYKITRVENYQALGPNDPYSDFVDLNGPGNKLVHNEDLFRRIYTAAGQLVFQTCFEANGDPSWGRMFVIASPA